MGSFTTAKFENVISRKSVSEPSGTLFYVGDILEIETFRGRI